MSDEQVWVVCGSGGVLEIWRTEAEARDSVARCAEWMDEIVTVEPWVVQGKPGGETERLAEALEAILEMDRPSEIHRHVRKALRALGGTR